MRKKIIVLILCSMMGLSLISCGKEADKAVAVPLDEDEEEIIELVKEDINIVTDEIYVETVGELLAHTDEFVGQIYQLEGVYMLEEGKEYLSRSLVNGNEKTDCNISLKYVQKTIEPDSWVRVTGVVNQEETDGENSVVLEIIALEGLAEQGKAELPWNGKFEHNH